MSFDPVHKPRHYSTHPSGVEAITITEALTFNVGNMLKYIWRASEKNGVEDVRKARWYALRELARLHSWNLKCLPMPGYVLRAIDTVLDAEPEASLLHKTLDLFGNQLDAIALRVIVVLIDEELSKLGAAP